MVGSAHDPFTRLGLTVRTLKFHGLIRAKKNLLKTVTALRASELKNWHLASPRRNTFKSFVKSTIVTNMGKVKQKQILSFHPCIAANRQVILGSRTLSPRDHGLIRKADAIILPQSCSQDLYEACKCSSAELFPNYDVRFKYPGKIGQYFLFKEFQLLHPETMPWISVDEFRSAVRQHGISHDFPFLIKGNHGHEGEGVFLITGPDVLESALRVLGEWEKTGQSGFVSQALIESDGNVLRAVILGSKIITYWKRPVLEGSVITTISKTAVVDKNWRKDLQKKARVQTRAFSRSTGTNLAALDFVFSMKSPEPHPLLLEVNYYFGRRGLGGSLNYYRLLYKALLKWLQEKGFDPALVRLL
jgi:ribosomal protein S6--L-glutamate ligase